MAATNSALPDLIRVHQVKNDDSLKTVNTKNAEKVLLKKLGSIPLLALQQSSRMYLGSMLNTDTKDTNADGLKLNWEGLAELMNLQPEIIEYIAAKRECKLESILNAWVRHDQRKTVSDLLRLIGDLGRRDILYDSKLHQLIEFDARCNGGMIQSQGHSSVKKKKKENTDIRLDPEDIVKIRRDENVKEHEIVVVQDKCLGHGEKPLIFDAYVSFSDKNMTFVRELIKNLEENHHLTLCIKERDLLAGSAKHSAVAHIIKERCKKVIVVMSPEYLESPECDFQTKVVLSQNRTPIVLMYHECKVPPEINFMCILRYNELPKDWFWNRLKKAVAGDKSHSTSISKRKKATEELSGSTLSISSLKSRLNRFSFRKSVSALLKKTQKHEAPTETSKKCNCCQHEHECSFTSVSSTDKHQSNIQHKSGDANTRVTRNKIMLQQYLVKEHLQATNAEQRPTTTIPCNTEGFSNNHQTHDISTKDKTQEHLTHNLANDDETRQDASESPEDYQNLPQKQFTEDDVKKLYHDPILAAFGREPTTSLVG